MSLQFDLKLPRRDFEINLSGEFGNGTVGVYGPSGAGKTSFFSLLAGLERPAWGFVSLNGRRLTETEKKINIPANKRRMGVVFQERLLFPHLSVRKNILFGERYTVDRKVRLETVVDLLDLAPVLDSMPGEISGGEQQRTAIGRALLTSPELLLLDEPFSAVDRSLRTSILPYLKRLRDEMKTPMLVISHDLPDIQRLTDTVFLINRGKCTGFGNLFDLFGKGDFSGNSTGLVNTLRLTDPEKLEENLFLCRLKGVPGVYVKTPAAPAKEFTLTVQPGEVSLSKKRIDGISIQNQIPGKMNKIVKNGNGVYCLIDAGIPIVSEVTQTAVKELDLKTGDPVVCLFKTHSLSL